VNRASRNKRSRGAAIPPSGAYRVSQLPIVEKLGMSRLMEELFGDPAYKGFVLQDKKRLPARFFARISGAPTSRLS
jgi:hypothetical protein